MTSSRTITARAPARIDLAGGTLDLWPLHLFFDHAATINFAIDQYAEVKLSVGPVARASEGTPLILRSEDRNVEQTFRSYGELREAFPDWKARSLPSALWLHARVARHFLSFWRQSAALRVETKCDSPAGAGLGGSSALNIALCNAFRALTLANYSDEELIPLARDLETTVIEVPAGVQDYWSAMFGDISCLQFDFGRVTRRVFYKQKEFLEKHVVLCYSGQSRNSGINNWSVFKNFIDGDAGVRSAFKGIVEATGEVEQALDRQSFDQFVKGISMEWEFRRKLAPTIATDEILSAMRVANEAGAKTAKICGAGGGGCFIVITPEASRANVVKALGSCAGVKVIDFKVSLEGCVVEQSE